MATIGVKLTLPLRQLQGENDESESVQDAVGVERRRDGRGQDEDP